MSQQIKNIIEYKNLFQQELLKFKANSGHLHSEFLQMLKLFNRDKELMLPVIQEFPHLLQYMDFTLRRDREICLVAIKKNFKAYSFIIGKLKSDPEIVDIVIRKNGKYLNVMPYNIKNDKTVVLIAVSQKMKYLSMASEAIRSDKDFILEMLNKDSSAIKYIGKPLVLEIGDHDHRDYMERYRQSVELNKKLEQKLSSFKSKI